MLLDYQATSWGRRAFWLIVGVAVPVTLWMLRGGEGDKGKAEPEKASEPVLAENPTVVAPPEPSPEDEKPNEPSPEDEQPTAVVSPEPAAQVEESPAEASAEPTREVETPAASVTPPGQLGVEISDSKDVLHPGQLVTLDRKQAKVTCEDTLALKEKVKLRVPTEAGTLTLGATLESVEGNVLTLKLMRLDAGLRKRLDAFLAQT
jgi:hypothetical protein